jgi:Delta6-protoilludene synthase
MNLFFVYDEYSDVMDAESVRVLAAIIMDALRNPQKARPKGESIAGEMTRT